MFSYGHIFKKYFETRILLNILVLYQIGIRVAGAYSEGSYFIVLFSLSAYFTILQYVENIHQLMNRMGHIYAAAGIANVITCSTGIVGIYHTLE